MVIASILGMRLASWPPALALLLFGCSNSANGDTRLTSCPPAPLPLPKSGTACNFSGEYYYAPPHVYRDGTADPFNDLWCWCADGGIDYAMTLVGCGGGCEAPPCDPGIVEGQSCTTPTNGECAALFTDGGLVESVCACDKPGPIWRCISLGDAG